MTTKRALITLLAVVALAACARADSRGLRRSSRTDSGAGASRAGAEMLVTSAPEDASRHCAAGGVKLGKGFDTNRNGVLEVPEVMTIWYVCSGPTGAPDPLVTSASEPAGASCAGGGVRLERGADANLDGALDAWEITTVSFVCNGGGHTPTVRRLASRGGTTSRRR